MYKVDLFIFLMIDCFYFFFYSEYKQYCSEHFYKYLFEHLCIFLGWIPKRGVAGSHRSVCGILSFTRCFQVALHVCANMLRKQTFKPFHNLMNVISYLLKMFLQNFSLFVFLYSFKCMFRTACRPLEKHCWFHFPFPD